MVALEFDRTPRKNKIYWVLSIATLLILFSLWHFQGLILPTSIITSHPTLQQEKPQNDALILYAYFETELARANAQFFIKHALHDNADFVFIINGDSDIDQFLPKNKSNIEVVRRENKCFDFGSYGEVLNANDREKPNRYKKFMMINSSIRGPFLPYWSGDCWSERFLSKVTESVKLVGTTFNCRPSRHIQSMLYATDQTGLSMLLDPTNEIYSKCHDHQSAIAAEGRTTGMFLDAGYEVDVMMQLFHDKTDHARTCTHGDQLFPTSHEGTQISPYETMFFKTIASVDPFYINMLSEWTDNAEYSSYDACRVK